LYVLLDIFSRYVVGWLVAEAENAALAQALIEETCHKYGIARDSLTLHSDRGSPMRAKTTAELMVDLGVAASFSRPRVSNDNPFSEAQFKTLKYRPDFPEAFNGIAHARSHLRPFFDWYNSKHRHRHRLHDADGDAFRQSLRTSGAAQAGSRGRLPCASGALQKKDPRPARVANDGRH
jgi:putative transposase